MKSPLMERPIFHHHLLVAIRPHPPGAPRVTRPVTRVRVRDQCAVAIAR
jgi:hypothetical protein